MSLCERCLAEIGRPQDRLPAPWFDHDAHQICETKITPTIWGLLEILRRRRGNLVSRDSLMTLLYGAAVANPPFDRVLSVYVCKLRRALIPTPFTIVTEYGRGYRLIDRGKKC